jgi:hypothetical protein
VPQVTTILDLIYKRFPEAHSGGRSLGMRTLVPISAKRSKRIIAISEATKSDVVSFLGIDPSHVDVTYLAPGFSDEIDPVPEAALRERARVDPLREPAKILAGVVGLCRQPAQRDGGLAFVHVRERRQPVRDCRQLPLDPCAQLVTEVTALVVGRLDQPSSRAVQIVHVGRDLRADPTEAPAPQCRRDAALLVADAHQPAVLLDRPVDIQAVLGECRVERFPLPVAFDVGERTVEVEDDGPEGFDGGPGGPARVPPVRPLRTRNRHA